MPDLVSAEAAVCEWKKKKEDDTDEDVAPEKYVWEAVYADGSVVKQYGDKFEYKEFSSVAAEKLKYLKLLPFDRGDIPGLIDRSNPCILIRVVDGYKPIQECRDVEIEGTIQRIHCLGVVTPTTSIIVVILPDNTIVVTEDVDKFLEELK